MACLAITSTTFPGFYTIFFTPTTLGTFCLTLTFGLCGGFIGAYFASKADPYWSMAGGIAGAITVSAGADLYHPSMTFLLAAFGAATGVWVGNWIDRKMRVDDGVGAFAIHGWCGMLGVLLLGIFVGGYPTGVDGVPTSFGGQLMGVMVILPMAFFLGYIPAWLLRKFNLLRVPPEVELEGVDVAEYGSDFFPEWGRSPETVVLPTGEIVPAEDVLREDFARANGHVPAGTPARGA
jgi:ammonia channel protein AmtB